MQRYSFFTNPPNFYRTIFKKRFIFVSILTQIKKKAPPKRGLLLKNAYLCSQFGAKNAKSRRRAQHQARKSLEIKSIYYNKLIQPRKNSDCEAVYYRIYIYLVLKVGIKFCLEGSFVAGTYESVNNFAILEEDEGWNIANA